MQRNELGLCVICRKPIRMMARKGTAVCSEICEKVQAGEPVPQHIEGEEGHHASD